MTRTTADATSRAFLENATLTVSALSTVNGGAEWTTTLTGIDARTGEPATITSAWHTNAQFEGLWRGDEQIVAPAQFRHLNRGKVNKAMRQYFGVDVQK
ncbi:MAG TPA: hypothetical protein DEG88_13880 [Propionibacteriaceae bacterium]|nr:hypothetical protein [Micropruina sp.]HBY24306.1 hypothetical protein [Propionibacteriaceae bacterium]